MTPAHEAFLNDLEALFRKHNMVLTSCGCCGGTYVIAAGMKYMPTLDEEITRLREQEKVQT